MVPPRGAPRNPYPFGVISRRGPFAPGDQAQLTDPKGRHHLAVLQPGKVFHTHRGSIALDDLIGSPEGSVVRSSSGIPYVALRPLLADFTLSMTRGAAVVYPKDAAQILAMADIWPGARVLEAGAGSGALSCWLLRAVGDGGLLVSYERRADFADIARANVERFFGGPPPQWELRPGEFGGDAGEGTPARGMTAPADRSRSTGWYWTCWRPGSASAAPHGRCCPAEFSPVTSPPRPSFPRLWRPFAATGVSTSLPRGNPSLAAGTPTGSRYAPSTGWWATPASWSPHGGSPRGSSRHRGGGGPPRARMTRRLPGDLRRCRRKRERKVQQGRVAGLRPGPG